MDAALQLKWYQYVWNRKFTWLHNNRVYRTADEWVDYNPLSSYVLRNGIGERGNYFNQTLYKKGYITEAQRNRLKNMIESRKPSTNIK